MMLFSIATRRAWRAGLVAATATGLVFGAACASQSEPASEYPDPPPHAGSDSPPASEQPEVAPEGGGAAGPQTAQPTAPPPAEPGASAEPDAPPQGGGAPPAHAGAAQGDTDVSDEEVSSFVSAYASIMQLQASLQDEFQQAGSPEEAQQIEERAQAEVVEAIEDEGLSMQRFDEIARQVQTDPELQQRVQEELGASGMM